jgi:hypothetical protein
MWTSSEGIEKELIISSWNHPFSDSQDQRVLESQTWEESLQYCIKAEFIGLTVR